MAFDKNNPKNRKRRKVCQFCVDKATSIDYKDTAKLRRYMSERTRSCLAVLPVFAPCISVNSLRP